jgi:dephospho-CoA kinase
MIKVGLTGNIGCGKSVVAEIFLNLGIPVYDADRNAKKFLNNDNVKNIIRKEFGDIVFVDNKEISKKKLAEIVFNDVIKLNKLNSLIHPFVIDDYKIWTELNKEYKYTIIEAAILFESGYDIIADKIITVTCTEQLRIKRIMARDNATEAEIKQRMKNQWDEEEKVKKSDFIIVNDQQLLLIPQVMAIHKQLSA